jgi:hypothetical protein
MDFYSHSPWWKDVAAASQIRQADKGDLMRRRGGTRNAIWLAECHASCTKTARWLEIGRYGVSAHG